MVAVRVLVDVVELESRRCAWQVHHPRAVLDPSGSFEPAAVHDAPAGPVLRHPHAQPSPIPIPQRGDTLVAWPIERHLVDLPVRQVRAGVARPGRPGLLWTCQRRESGVREIGEVVDRGAQCVGDWPPAAVRALEAPRRLLAGVAVDHAIELGVLVAGGGSQGETLHGERGLLV